MGTPTNEDYREYLARIAHLDDLLDQVRECYRYQTSRRAGRPSGALVGENIRLHLAAVVVENTDDPTFDENFMQWWRAGRDQREHDEATVVGVSEDVAIGPRR